MKRKVALFYLTESDIRGGFEIEIGEISDYEFAEIMRDIRINMKEQLGDNFRELLKDCIRMAVTRVKKESK
jgi:hypothetical protein